VLEEARNIPLTAHPVAELAALLLPASLSCDFNSSLLQLVLAPSILICAFANQ
jgi:hypothetical protein